jgi:hypothetical protein
MATMDRLIGYFSAVAILGGLGCSGSNESASTTGGDGGSAPGPEIKGVLFQGSATASELTALVASASSTKLTPMPGFTNPPPTSEYLPKDPPPTFSWSDKGRAPSGTTERTYLQFSADGEGQLLRVFTSEKSYRPTEAEWKKVSVGTWVTVDIFGGSYAHGTLQGDSAEGNPVLFCSMPATN